MLHKWRADSSLENISPSSVEILTWKYLSGVCVLAGTAVFMYVSTRS